MEGLARELAESPTPWADFGGNPTPAQVEELSRQQKVEGQEAAAKIAETITALDTLFSAVCSALDWEGLTLTGGKISRLVALGMPEHLAADLETLHKEHRATIPEAERLTLEDATALYNELTKEGLISGPLEAFIYHFGKLSADNKKRLNTGLSWLGTMAQFAFFAQRVTMYMQPGPYGYMIQRKALCLAFGIDERQRCNVFGPYCSDFRGERQSCKGSEQIKRIFETLPGNNNAGR